MSQVASIPDGYLTKTGLCAFLGGVGKSTISEWVRTRGFPKPIRLSQNLIIWRKSDVNKWVDSHEESPAEEPQSTPNSKEEAPLMGGWEHIKG